MIKKYETGDDYNIIENTKPKEYNFNKITTYNDVIFKTNNLEEALEHMEMKINAIKYNL